jgi:hypothetical protein
MKNAIPEISAGARLIHARLAKVPVSEVVTYEELSRVAQTNVLTHRWLLETGRNLARRQEGMLFAPVRGVGLKRLDDIGIGDDVNRDRKLIHRKGVRSLRKVECVTDLAGMPDADRTRLLATASCMGAIVHATSTPTIKKLSAVVQKSPAKLPLAETLEAIK